MCVCPSVDRVDEVISKPLVILDFGSGETCRNDWRIVRQMIEDLKDVDTGKCEVVIKWQLFKKISYSGGELLPLDLYLFDIAHNYADKLGYKTTASVFDNDSLEFLTDYEVPFIKIANNKKYYYLIDKIEESGNKPLVSINSPANMFADRYEFMCCVSDYPATAEKYEAVFHDMLEDGISDHTDNWYLYEKYKPFIYECHYCLPDSTGPDAGAFARRPDDLRRIL